MDPVLAFSLAAGALQFLDVGFRALSTYREIYQAGSLAEHRHSKEIAEQLLATTEQLEKSVQTIPASAAKYSKDVVEVSKKCSVTATELLTELTKLQQDSQSGHRQTIGKSVRAIRKKRFLADTQKKLERYRDSLNTRILAKLDFHALQQVELFNTLEQDVKNLAVGLKEGRNTFEQLLADQTMTLQKHADRRIDDQADEVAIQRAQQQFRDSLIFPEISKRQEEITNSHAGTCRWIFDSPRSRDRDQPRAESLNAVNYSATVKGFRAQPWPSFEGWLEADSNDPYWLNGKPGSGKSTLMKYVSAELGHHCQSRQTLFPWRDAVKCSFFFWNLGSPLQKNYVGLLRSLLFQIAIQRPEMIRAMRGKDENGISSQIGYCGLAPVHTWTEQRLEDALKRFLAEKPSSLRMCLFLDGLDEFVGDEDSLINTIGLLSQTSGVKVCVSSRPEQIFRQGFATSPQLKLQDLNYLDIQKATSERLIPALKSYVLDSDFEADALVKQVVVKSQGIFLWAALMAKDLERGAKNSDSIEELRGRLERTPDTIEGLYEHMLNRLDKIYLRDAARYFHHLLAYQDNLEGRCVPPTLLEIVCSEGNTWGLSLRNTALSKPSEFYEPCRRVETRILTRCVGLVENEERPQKYPNFLQLRRLSDGGRVKVSLNRPEGLLHCLREVKFIHKTVVDFLQNHGEFFVDPDWRLKGTISALRGRIAVASFTPNMIQERASLDGLILLNPVFIADLMGAYWPCGDSRQVIRDTAIEIVDETYDLLSYLNTTFNGPNYTISQSYDETQRSKHGMTMEHRLAFRDRLDFAAFYGRHDYVSRYMARVNFLQRDVERVLSCAIFGFEMFSMASVKRLEGLLNILQDYVPRSGHSEMNWAHASSRNAARVSKWALFADFVFLHFPHKDSGGRPSTPDTKQPPNIYILCRNVTKLFLDHDAKSDPNIMLVRVLRTRFIISTDPNPVTVEVYFGETVLALIERLVLSKEPTDLREHMKDIEDLLRARGGTKRRVFLSVRYPAQPRSPGITLTADQSERLLGVFPTETLAARSTFNSFAHTGLQIGPMASHPDPTAEEIVSFIVGSIRSQRVPPSD